jgi:hypothetical protein
MAERVFRARPASAEAAAAARRLAGGNTDAVWCARPDGTIEVATPRRWRIELHRADADGTTTLLAVSRRSVRDLVVSVLFVSVFVGWFGWLLTDVRALAYVGLLALVACLIVAWVGKVEDPARAWLWNELGTTAGWTTVPRQVSEETPPTGNQLITIAELADAGAGVASFRERDDGTVEVASRSDVAYERHVVDRAGEATLVSSTARDSEKPSWRTVAVAVALFAGGLALNPLTEWPASGPVGALMMFAGAAVGFLAWAGTSSSTGAEGEGWRSVRTDEPDD